MFYKKLDIDDFKKTQDKIVPYVIDFVTQDIKESEEKIFFNFISDEDLEKFKQDIPELFECIKEKLDSEIILMSYIYVDDFNMNEFPIHSDNILKKRTRLNWPILNGESAATIIYEKIREDIPSVIHSYKSGVTGHAYNSNDCYEIDRYILDTPTLMNVQQIHGIEILDHKLPRILLTMRLSNEEEVYQKYF